MKTERIAGTDIFIFSSEKKEDERGSFARVYSEDLLRKENINFCPMQNSLSLNKKRGTIRGMHFQRSPKEEGKFVTVVAGEIVDILVDIRKTSVNFGKHYVVPLSSRHYNSIFIPKGYAHGFQTLEDETIIHYMIDTEYSPAHSDRFSPFSASLNLPWPIIEGVIISDIDKEAPSFEGKYV